MGDPQRPEVRLTPLGKHGNLEQAQGDQLWPVKTRHLASARTSNESKQEFFSPFDRLWALLGKPEEISTRFTILQKRFQCFCSHPVR